MFRIARRALSVYALFIATGILCGVRIALTEAADPHIQAARPQDASLSASAVRIARSREQTPSVVAPATSSQRALLDKYCVTCHNDRRRTAGLTLDVDLTDLSAGADVWEKVIRKLRTGTMPPVGAPRPDQASSDALATYLETSLDRGAASSPNPGRTETFHRLNRAEYQNVIRDLLALEIDAASFLPPDNSDNHGFDNLADVLSVSPALLERYLAAAQKIRVSIWDG